MKNIFTCIAVLLLLAVAHQPAVAQKKQIAYYSEVLDNGMFIPYDTGTMEYDAQGRLKTDTYTYFDAASQKWINFTKYIYTYNAQGTIDYYEFQTYNINKWQPFIKYQHSYNTAGQLETIFEQRMKAGVWTNSLRENYYYGANGKKDTVVIFSIDENGKEKGSSMAVYTYNAMGAEDMQINHWWNSTDARWELSGRTLYTYDSAGRLQKSEYDRFTSLNGWEKTYFYIYNYDAENLLRTWERTDYNLNTVTQRGYHFYEFDGPLTALQPTMNPAKVYPNPATTQATISWETGENHTLTVLDISGKKVYEATQLPANSTTINTENFKSGMYFFVLQSTGGNALHGKFIVE